MKVTDYTPLSTYKILEDWIELSANNMNMFSGYWSSYIKTVSKLSNLAYPESNPDALNSSNALAPKPYFHDFLGAGNSEFEKLLRSKESLQYFRDLMETILSLDSIQRQVFPRSFLSYADNIIDNSLPYPNSLVSVNQTPHEVIKQMDGVRLLHYHGPKESSTGKYATPLLMVYAPINRYHILDLSPQRSIVNKFVSAGFDVFLLDWGEKQTENKPEMSDYVQYMDQAFGQIERVTKQEKINLYGYSWGGTFSLIYSAIYGSGSRVKNLILQSTNLDFDNDDTVVAGWMRNFPVERFDNEFKEMFGHFIDMAFLMRNPAVHSFDNVKYALDMKEENMFQFVQSLVKIGAWLRNTPDIPGPLFRQFVVDLYQENLLVKNKLSIIKKEKDTIKKTETTTVNLKDISVPLLNIIGNKDDLVSPRSSIPINDSVSSKDKITMEFPSGHVELCISHDAHKNLWPQAVEWLESRSELR